MTEIENKHLQKTQNFLQAHEKKISTVALIVAAVAAVILGMGITTSFVAATAAALPLITVGAAGLILSMLAVFCLRHVRRPLDQKEPEAISKNSATEQKRSGIQSVESEPLKDNKDLDAPGGTEVPQALEAEDEVLVESFWDWMEVESPQNIKTVCVTTKAEFLEASTNLDDGLSDLEKTKAILKKLLGEEAAKAIIEQTEFEQDLNVFVLSDVPEPTDSYSGLVTSIQSKGFKDTESVLLEHAAYNGKSKMDILKDLFDQFKKDKDRDRFKIEFQESNYTGKGEKIFLVIANLLKKSLLAEWGALQSESERSFFRTRLQRQSIFPLNGEQTYQKLIQSITSSQEVDFINKLLQAACPDEEQDEDIKQLIVQQVMSSILLANQIFCASLMVKCGKAAIKLERQEFEVSLQNGTKQFIFHSHRSIRYIERGAKVYHSDTNTTIATGDREGWSSLLPTQAELDGVYARYSPIKNLRFNVTALTYLKGQETVPASNKSNRWVAWFGGLRKRISGNN
jgi:hypothetical protein